MRLGMGNGFWFWVLVSFGGGSACLREADTPVPSGRRWKEERVLAAC
jgi:hypothetical protein